MAIAYIAYTEPSMESALDAADLTMSAVFSGETHYAH